MHLWCKRIAASLLFLLNFAAFCQFKKQDVRVDEEVEEKQQKDNEK
jgi:hypothetical protein